MRHHTIIPLTTGTVDTGMVTIPTPITGLGLASMLAAGVVMVGEGKVGNGRGYAPGLFGLSSQNRYRLMVKPTLTPLVTYGGR